MVGLGVLAPDIRERYELSLTQIGFVLGATSIGSVLTLLAWGVVADRIGERLVIALGLSTAGVALVAAGLVHGFVPLAGLLVLAGITGASVNAASGRAVMHWFGQQQRGLALGVRQTAIPIGGAAAALGLPHAGGARWGLGALGLGCATGALVAGLLIREAPNPTGPAPGRALEPLRDRRMWRLSVGSALMLAPQICLVGFMVLFLHDRRGLGTAQAGAVLAAVNVLAIGTRIAAGHWSDVLGSRVVPLRRIALASAALVLVATALVSAPLVVLVPELIVTGCVVISWNGLAFTAAAEVAGPARSGAALGFQQTMLAVAGAVMPVAFGAIVAATTWRTGFGLAAFGPLAGWRILRRLSA